LDAQRESVIVGLGSNLGDSQAHLRWAVDALHRLQSELGLQLAAVSPLYRSAPWQTQGPDFLNAVAVLEGMADEDTPLALLRRLQELERERGRVRPYRYAPRTLDLDLILFGQRVIDLPQLQVPHPRALERAFVLQPLLDVRPHLQWPALGSAWLRRLCPLEHRLLVVHDPDWPLTRSRSGHSPA